MRFPHPVTVVCPACDQPTVVAETSLGSERVHCGTWRWQCDTQPSAAQHGERSAARPVALAAPDTLGDQELAA